MSPSRFVFDSVAGAAVFASGLQWIELGQTVIAGAQDEKQKREAIKKNYCFVCGFERDKYEDLGLDSTPFNHHVDHNEGEHAVWQYVYFKAYLKAKNPNRLSGIESYVQKEFNRGVFALAWVPNRTSFVIELEGKGKGKAQQRGGDEDGTK